MSDLFTFVPPDSGSILWESSEPIVWESGEEIIWSPGVGPPTAARSMLLSSADILSLTGVGVRADSFVFELLDVHHNVIGPLKVSETSAPTVTNDTTRSVFRTCTGLTVLDGNQGDDGTFLRLADIDPLRSRLRVSMVLQNGEAFPLGVFMFGDDTRKPFSWGTEWTPALFDETFVVDDPLDQTYGLAPGDSIVQLVNLLVEQCNLASVDLSAVVDQHAASAVTYAAGSSRNQAIIALLALLGVLPPFFDNDGTYTAKAAPASGQGPDHILASGTIIIDGSTSTTSSLYRAPNRYQVIGSDPSGAFIGTYDLPDSAANSFVNTGDRVVSSTTMQGVPSTAVANLAAYVNALTDRNNYIAATASTTADPTFGTFDLVQLYGVMLIETAWSLVCSSGGSMTHTLAGFYPS